MPTTTYYLIVALIVLLIWRFLSNHVNFAEIDMDGNVITDAAPRGTDYCAMIMSLISDEAKKPSAELTACLSKIAGIADIECSDSIMIYDRENNVVLIPAKLMRSVKKGNQLAAKKAMRFISKYPNCSICIGGIEEKSE